MKTIKYMLIAAVILAMAVPAVSLAQDPTITGSFTIDYPSRTPEGTIVKDVNNVYKLDLVVSDKGKPLIGFNGKILERPPIRGLRGQQGSLNYDVTLRFYPPGKDPIPMGKIVGIVPIEPTKNVYRFNDGTVRLSVGDRPGFKGFVNKVTGNAYGRPPKDEKQGRIKKTGNEVLRFFKKMRDGNWVQKIVDDYDQMIFRGVTLGGGPFLPEFSNLSVDGSWYYNYGDDSWDLDVVTVSASGVRDVITGTIPWTEEDVSGGKRPGTYTFYVNYNEPQPTSDEKAVLADKAPVASSMDAFLTGSTEQPSITGTMTFVDTMLTEKLPSKSEVKVNLVCNKLDRRQAVDFTKKLLTAVVPFFNE